MEMITVLSSATLFMVWNTLFELVAIVVSIVTAENVINVVFRIIWFALVKISTPMMIVFLAATLFNFSGTMSIAWLIHVGIHVVKDLFGIWVVTFLSAAISPWE